MGVCAVVTAMPDVVAPDTAVERADVLWKALNAPGSIVRHPGHRWDQILSERAGHSGATVGSSLR